MDTIASLRRVVEIRIQTLELLDEAKDPTGTGVPRIDFDRLVVEWLDALTDVLLASHKETA